MLMKEKREARSTGVDPRKLEELKRLAGEAEQIRAYSAELEQKSHQMEATAAKLARAKIE